MQLSEDFIKDFEIEYLRIIIDLLDKGELTIEQAKESAAYYLTLLPYTDMSDLENKAKTFIEKYPWAQKLNIFLMNHKENAQTKDVLEKMRTLMKDNKIDEALNLAQK